MMKHFVSCLLLCVLITVPAMAQAARCYTPEQYRAEQVVRFHTNLMVMGLYCKSVLKQNTYATYQDFTRRNQNIIKAEENRLIAYFQNNSGKNAERELHTMRTDLANRISLQAGQSITRFCRQYTPYYEQAKTMIPADFKRWIEQINISAANSSVPLCSQSR